MSEYFECSVFLEDTDATGVVYHARYLQFLERARTTYFLENGLDHTQLVENQQGSFVVYHIDIYFKRAAKLGERLKIKTSIKKVKGASIELSQEIRLNDQICVSADILLVYADPIKGKPLKITKELQTLLSQFC